MALAEAREAQNSQRSRSVAKGITGYLWAKKRKLEKRKAWMGKREKREPKITTGYALFKEIKSHVLRPGGDEGREKEQKIDAVCVF